MNTDKFNELKESLDKEEERIRAIKAGIDPAQIAELESTKGVLRFWEQQIKSMARNTENEDGSMFRLVDKPHQVALKIIGFEDGEVTKRLGFPASKRDMLNKLQVKLAVFNDKIEVNCLFPIEPINIQLCTSAGGLRGIFTMKFNIIPHNLPLKRGEAKRGHGLVFQTAPAGVAPLAMII